MNLLNSAYKIFNLRCIFKKDGSVRRSVLSSTIQSGTDRLFVPSDYIYSKKDVHDQVCTDRFPIGTDDVS